MKKAMEVIFHPIKNNNLVKSVLMIAVILLVSGFFVVSSINTFAAPGPITVCATECNHMTIQEAIDNADPGVTIEVGAGIYNEGTLLIHKKNLTVKTDNGNSQTATLEQTIVEITGNGVTLDGFKIRNYQNDSDKRLVVIDAEDVTVGNLDFYMDVHPGNEPFEIKIQNNAHGASVLNNVIDRGWEGGHSSISLGGANDVLIEGNKIAENGASAIGGGMGENLVLRNNIVYNGFDEGIWLSGSGKERVIEGNVIENYNVGNKGSKALKIVGKPTSVNNETETLAMRDLILADNSVDTVELSWMKDVHNVTQDTFFDTIQEAIDEAGEDDTVEVAPGTYEENIIISSNGIKIKSTVEHEAVIKPASGDIIKITATGVFVEDFKLDGSEQSGSFKGIHLGGPDAEVLNNQIIGNSPEAGDNTYISGTRGILFSGTNDNALIQGNYFTQWHTGVFNQASTGVTIDNNTFENVRSANANDGVADVTYTDNTYINSWNGPSFDANIDGFVIIEGNTFDINNKAVTIRGYRNGNSEDTKINHNSFSGNAEMGVDNSSEEEIDATLNWWGHETGPYHSDTNSEGQGNEVSDYVLFDPWWTNEEMTTDSDYVEPPASPGGGGPIRFTPPTEDDGAEGEVLGEDDEAEGEVLGEMDSRDYEEQEEEKKKQLERLEEDKERIEEMKERANYLLGLAEDEEQEEEILAILERLEELEEELNKITEETKEELEEVARKRRLTEQKEKAERMKEVIADLLEKAEDDEDLKSSLEELLGRIEEMKDNIEEQLRL
jgi:hypothetical protein